MTATAADGFVRPFVITGGRTSPGVDLRIEAVLVSTPGAWRTRLDPERAQLLHLCREPQSVAEVASILGLAVGVVRILAGDLLEQGLVEAYRPRSNEFNVSLLERVLEGVRGL